MKKKKKWMKNFWFYLINFITLILFKFHKILLLLIYDPYWSGFEILSGIGIVGIVEILKGVDVFSNYDLLNLEFTLEGRIVKF